MLPAGVIPRPGCHLLLVDTQRRTAFERGIFPLSWACVVAGGFSDAEAFLLRDSLIGRTSAVGVCDDLEVTEDRAEVLGFLNGDDSFVTNSLCETFSASELCEGSDIMGAGAAAGRVHDSSISELSSVRSPMIDDETSSNTSPVKGFGGFSFVRSDIRLFGSTSLVIFKFVKAQLACYQESRP